MKDRVLRDFTQEDLNQVTETFHHWQTGESYKDVAGFCQSAELGELQKHDYVLTPGRYVGAVAEKDDGEPFADKMARLTTTLKAQFAESDRLDAEIKRTWRGWGMSSKEAALSNTLFEVHPQSTTPSGTRMLI